MADNILTPGSIPSGLLPADYQAQIDAANRQKAIASALMQRGFNLQAPDTGNNPIAARISPFAAIASALSGAGGAYLGNQADQNIRNVQSQYQTDALSDIGKMNALPEAQRIAFGQSSRFPQTQALAKTLQEQAEKRREAGAKAISDAGDVSGSLGYTGNPSDYSPKSLQAPQVQWITDANDPTGARKIPTIVEFDKYGRPTQKFGPAGTNISLNLPSKEAELTVEQIGKNLDERRKEAALAKGTLASNAQAIDALTEGAQAGGAEGVKQGLRKALQAFGVQLSDTAPTEQLQMALGHAVLENAKKLAPVAGPDIQILEKDLGSISTDPTALTRALAFTNAGAYQTLKGYNEYVGQNKQNLDPRLQQLFQGATSGYEMPQSLMGPLPFQLETVRKLRERGFDISQLRDPSGAAFDPNAKFEINPTAGFPGVANGQPKPIVPQIKKVFDQASYDLVPIGEQYQAPDGSIRIKGGK
jgi:hypothetical protein